MRSLFRTGHERLESLRREQTNRLSRTQKRLKAQDERLLTWKDVFGDLPQSEEFIQLINEWLNHPEHKKAAAKAKLSTPSEKQQAYA